MADANAHPVPRTYLDRAVVRLALAEARNLVAQGHSLEQAATLARRARGLSGADMCSLSFGTTRRSRLRFGGLFV
jgi:hypothetical protein